LVVRGSAGEVWRFTSRPVFDAEGRVAGWRDCFTDISAAEAAIQRCREIEVSRDEAAEQAARRLRDKDQFLARVSHELRTPLTAVIGFCHILLDHSGPLSALQQTSVQKILKNASVLLQLLNNVLDMAKMCDGPVSLCHESVDLAMIVSEAAATVEPQSYEKALESRMAIEPGLPEVITDRLKVKQILINLLSNAVKYTESGSITVQARYVAAHDEVWLSVADTGIGIAPADLERVFEAYAQIDPSSRINRQPSTGLGLTICRMLAERLSARIEVESALGQGSVFTLCLPREAPPSEARGASPSAPA
jgi:signal transduction histidine kinase